jgi:MFS family permease
VSTASDPSKWRALALLALAMVLSMSTWFSASAVLPALRERWSLGSVESSLLTIAVQIGFVAGALLSAITNLSDIVPARRVFFIASLGAAGANALVVVVGGFAPALLARAATGFFIAGVYPPAMKVMATHFRTGRGMALGVMIGALTVGSAMPHLVNGLGGLEWQTVVIVTSVMTVAGGLIAISLVRDGPFPFARATFRPRYILQSLRDPAVRLVNLGYFGHMWELYAMWSWFAIFFGESVRAATGSQASDAGPLGAFAAIATGALGCYAGGIMGDRWGRTRTTALAMAVSGTCALVIGFTFGAAPWIVLAIGLVWGFAVVADSAQFSTMLTEVADQAYIGTTLTFQLAAGFTLSVATIWLVPVLRDAFGWWAAFAALAPGPFLGVLAMLALRGRPEAAKIAGGRG